MGNVVSNDSEWFVQTRWAGRALICFARWGVWPVLLLLLTGCSYGYDLRAIVLAGRLAFVVDPASQQDANCIRSISVSAESGPAAAPSDGDDRQLVKHGVVWSKDTAVTECLNRFPILYGQPLTGQPFLPPGVAAKPLRVATVYTVETTGSGSGYGSGRFRIRRDHTVENLPPVDMSAVLLEPVNGN